MKSNMLIDSGNTEWYTPNDIIEAARSAMGSIDLDPFSCEIANRAVKAGNFFSKDDDGFEKEWFGNVWCNHPFSRVNNRRIFEKAEQEFSKGHVASICMITFASTSEQWFVKSLKYPQCYIHGRTNYLDQRLNKIKGVTKGSVVTYIGNSVHKFYESFKKIGTVKIAYSKGD